MMTDHDYRMGTASTLVFISLLVVSCLVSQFRKIEITKPEKLTQSVFWSDGDGMMYYDVPVEVTACRGEDHSFLVSSDLEQILPIGISNLYVPGYDTPGKLSWCKDRTQRRLLRTIQLLKGSQEAVKEWGSRDMVLSVCLRGKEIQNIRLVDSLE